MDSESCPFGGTHEVKDNIVYCDTCWEVRYGAWREWQEQELKERVTEETSTY